MIEIRNLSNLDLSLAGSVSKASQLNPKYLRRPYKYYLEEKEKQFFSIFPTLISLQVFLSISLRDITKIMKCLQVYVWRNGSNIRVKNFMFLLAIILLQDEYHSLISYVQIL